MVTRRIIGLATRKQGTRAKLSIAAIMPILRVNVLFHTYTKPSGTCSADTAFDLAAVFCPLAHPAHKPITANAAVIPNTLYTHFITTPYSFYYNREIRKKQQIRTFAPFAVILSYRCFTLKSPNGTKKVRMILVVVIKLTTIDERQSKYVIIIALRRRQVPPPSEIS